MTKAEKFNLFMSQLQETNQTLDYFCDFDKIEENVDEIKLDLCMLNSLIGSRNLRKSVEAIWRKDKTAFSVMDILIATRRKDGKKYVDVAGGSHLVSSLFNSVDGVMVFLQETGLAELLQSQKINDLVDYVFGVETGLDSNARKNRSGHIMEATVAQLIDDAGIDCRTEVYSSEWPELSDALGTDEKRFDFVIETVSTTYLIEVNFYSNGGSKLNEVARSYSELAPKVNAVPGFKFVWVTDGVGWESARNKLQEAFHIIPDVYNLTTFKSFLRKIR